ncbi:MAG TPA: hypothetical protein VIY10_15265 [Solirubrobacteraceae bacterium]
MAGERAAEEIAPGLWRWTARHPAWQPGAETGSPGDWDANVGCVLCVDARSALFFDPLLPADAGAFWRWCDGVVGSRSVHVLTTIRFHGRSREAVAARYGGEVVTSLRSLPSDVEAFRFTAADETMFWLPTRRALIPGDRLIGDDAGGVRLCPDSWLAYLREPLDQAGLRTLLRPLLDLPVQRVLVSHGEPLLTGGAAALERILA